MIIPIMHRRQNSRYRFLFISLIVTFILSMFLLVNSEIMTALGYKMVESIALVVVSIHILVLFIFLFSKTIVEIGKLHLLENGFEIKLHSSGSNIYLKSTVRFKLIIQGYKGAKSNGAYDRPYDGLGNFLVIQTMNSTIFYELLFNSQLDMIMMLEYLRKADYPGMIGIENNSDNLSQQMSEPGGQ